MGKGELTRQRIIDAADDLIYRKGYNQSAFSDVVGLTGLSKGNITYYFKSKDELLAAVIDQRKRRISGLLQGWDREFPSVGERLDRFAEMLMIETASLIQFGCPMGSLISELGKTHSMMAPQAREMFDLFISWLTRQFAGYGYSSKQSKQLALRFLSQAQGASLIAHAYGDAEIIRRAVLDLKEWSRSLDKAVNERNA
jgi:AcrR family transcriptional regulator